MLMDHRVELDSVSEALLERESLGHDDLSELIGKPVARACVDDSADDLANHDTIDEKTVKANNGAWSDESDSDNIPLKSKTPLGKPTEPPDEKELS